MKRSILLNVLILLFSTTILMQAQEKELNQSIIIETSMGDIEVLLYDETPLHRDNMIKLVKEGFYTDHLFHRVIDNFMIQGGDPHSVGAPKGQRLGNGGPGYRIPAEFNDHLYHKKGAIAAARMGDDVNPKKESSGSQFYLVEGRSYNKRELAKIQADWDLKPFSPDKIKVYETTGGTPFLDGNYTVFGEIVKGMDVLEAIAAVQTDPYDRPVEDVVFSIKLK